MVDLVEVAMVPNRPSDLIGMGEAGHSGRVRLAFDLMAVKFYRELRAFENETVEVQAPKRAKRTVPAPAHTKEDLLRVLGYPDWLIDRVARDGLDDPEADALANDILANRVDWRTFGEAG